MHLFQDHIQICQPAKNLLENLGNNRFWYQRLSKLQVFAILFESKFVNAMDASMNAGNRQGADLYSPLNGGAGAGNAGTGTGAAAAGGSSR